MTETLRIFKDMRAVLDTLIEDRPMLAAKRCGTTTIGNLRAEINAVVTALEHRKILGLI